MPEDYLPEAKRVLSGRFYGMFFPITKLSLHSFMLLWYSFLYFRVSKRSPLLSGRCKWFHNFVLIGEFQLFSCGIVQCGEVVEQTTCNVCGATIGGLVYKLAQDNRDARR